MGYMLSKKHLVSWVLLLIITMSLLETQCAAGSLLASEIPCTLRVCSNSAIALLLVDDFVLYLCWCIDDKRT